MKNVIVIGAGPGGMMAAGQAALAGNKVTLIEKNRRVGRKLMITGKGRCNLTNDCDVDTFLRNIPTNPKFLYSALSAFSPADTMAFFTAQGLALKTERGRRVFPTSDKAVDVVDAMHKFILSCGVNLISGRVRNVFSGNGQISGVRLENGRTINADAVILATGGMSYPLTGSTGDGYAIAKGLGHTVMPIRSALAPLELEGVIYKKLQGLSLKNITLTLMNNDKAVFTETGELIFTHFGISGPLVLSASSMFTERSVDNVDKYTICTDLKPGLDEDKLDKRILRDFEKNKNRDFGNALSELFPKKLIPVIVELSGVPANQKINTITAVQRKSLLQVIKGLCFDVRGLRPVEEAIVTRGGVKTNEINPCTMESKLVTGLYFAGEIIDVNGFTGGFNLQIAFSTGYAAGTAIQ